MVLGEAFVSSQHPRHRGAGPSRIAAGDRFGDPQVALSRDGSIFRPDAELVGDPQHREDDRLQLAHHLVLGRLQNGEVEAAVREKERLDIELLVFEVLNIRSIGPNLELSVDADHSDGVFSVVTAGEEHRDLHLRYLEDRMAGTDQRLRIPTRPARTSHMTLSIEAAAEQYLA